MKAKIDSSKASRTFGDPPVQVYEVVAGGVVYDCMSKKCMDLIGQEVEFEVKQPSDPKYHPTMRFKGEGAQQTGGKFSGRGYQVPFGQTADGEKLRTKAMVMSYAKDIVVQHMTTYKPDVPFSECLGNVKVAYDSLIAFLQVDQVQDRREQSSQAGQTGNGHKDLPTLLAEMKPIVSLDALSNWWKTIPTAFNALPAEDQQKLVAEKDKKKAEFATAGGKAQTNRQPNF